MAREEAQGLLVPHGTPSLARPGIADLLPRLRRGDVLMVARLDRLSRSLVDFAGLMQEATKAGWSLVALDLGVDNDDVTGLGSPGGAAKVGPVAKDHPKVASWA